MDDIADVTTNELTVQKNNLTEPPARKNEKRILLTPWSKMNYDQNAITIPTPKNQGKFK